MRPATSNARHCDRKYAKKLQSLQDRVRRAEQKVDRERSEASGAKMQSFISMGAAVLSSVLAASGSAPGPLAAIDGRRGATRAAQQADDVYRAEADLGTYRERLAELEQELESELRAIEQRLDVYALQIEELPLKPRRRDVNVRWSRAWHSG